jgi:hypothetical protein
VNDDAVVPRLRPNGLPTVGAVVLLVHHHYPELSEVAKHAHYLIDVRRSLHTAGHVECR